MQKKILLAVDGSIHSKQAVRYAARLARVNDALFFDLLHIQPAISLYLTEASNPAPLKALMAKQSREAHRLLERYQDEMLRLEVDPQRVALKTLPRKQGVAKDLLDYGQAGRYDALLVGRRGASYVTELIMGSVTAGLIEHTEVIPIWVVDGDVASDKILLAIDGSENSLRALDHVAFILTGQSAVKLEILHVEPKIGAYCQIDFSDPVGAETAEIILSGHRRCIDDFYSSARAVLKNAGFPQDRCRIKVVKNRLRAGKAVLDELHGGDYGTLVVGRQGQGRSMFSGSVARYVISKATGCALWVVP